MVWRSVRAEWREEARGQSKLEVTELGGIEIGRWHGVRREGRECGMQ